MCQLNYIISRNINFIREFWVMAKIGVSLPDYVGRCAMHDCVIEKTVTMLVSKEMPTCTLLVNSCFMIGLTGQWRIQGGFLVARKPPRP